MSVPWAIAVALVTVAELAVAFGLVFWWRRRYDVRQKLAQRPIPNASDDEVYRAADAAFHSTHRLVIRLLPAAALIFAAVLVAIVFLSR